MPTLKNTTVIIGDRVLGPGDSVSAADVKKHNLQQFVVSDAKNRTDTTTAEPAGGDADETAGHEPSID